MNVHEMTPKQKEDYVFNTLNRRCEEMLENPEIMALYQSQPSEEEAKQWLFDQALITLCFSPQERMARAIAREANDQ